MSPSLGTQLRSSGIGYITQHQIYFQRMHQHLKRSFLYICCLSPGLKPAPWQEGFVLSDSLLSLPSPGIVSDVQLSLCKYLINRLLMNKSFLYFEPQQLHSGFTQVHITWPSADYKVRKLGSQKWHRGVVMDEFVISYPCGYIASCHLLWLATDSYFIFFNTNFPYL